MKKAILSCWVLLFALSCAAQQPLAFPFQGGRDVMRQFFKDNIEVPKNIIDKKASGTVVFKFTADTTGSIKKIIIYYADDFVLTEPLIAALKKSDRKWVIPFREKTHDFIIPFRISLLPPATANLALQKAIFDFQKNRQPILADDQVPLDLATLLPAITINYKLN